MIRVADGVRCGVVAAALLAAGCQTVYYQAMEKVGLHKRDLLIKRVDAARDAQEDAKEQFRDALEQFRSVIQVADRDLAAAYDRLRAELDRSEARAERVRSRIAAVESVSSDLFREWESELAQYRSAALRQSSEATLRSTQRRYDRFIAAMVAAEQRMEPVLAAFRDQVLYLKHNLNAQAVASLRQELASIEGDVETLVREMERSITEADALLFQMKRDAQ